MHRQTHRHRHTCTDTDPQAQTQTRRHRHSRSHTQPKQCTQATTHNVAARRGVAAGMARRRRSCRNPAGWAADNRRRCFGPTSMSSCAWWRSRLRRIINWCDDLRAMACECLVYAEAGTAMMLRVFVALRGLPPRPRAVATHSHTATTTHTHTHTHTPAQPRPVRRMNHGTSHHTQPRTHLALRLPTQAETWSGSCRFAPCGQM